MSCLMSVCHPTGAALMLVPVLLTYFFSQRGLLQGKMVSGVKG
jgi:ABC-type glycerol-3-phosphate transport system permease component